MSTKKLTLLVVFLSFSIVGAMIKIPAIVASIALDSFPALAAAALLGPVSGAVTAVLGHLGSAFLGGMPLGPLHVLVAAEMGIILFLFGILYRKEQRLLASSFFFISNGLLAALPFALIIGWPFYFALLPSLLIGTAVNLAVAIFTLPKIQQATRGVLKRNA